MGCGTGLKMHSTVGFLSKIPRAQNKKKYIFVLFRRYDDDDFYDAKFELKRHLQVVACKLFGTWGNKYYLFWKKKDSDTLTNLGYKVCIFIIYCKHKFSNN